MLKKYAILIFIAFVLLGWTTYIFINDYSILDIYSFAWPMVLTMIIGAFIAGATAEGGGAIAFPVMTLLLSIAPIDARIFSLSIQSFGMTAASVLILSKGIKIVKRCVVYVCLPAILGFILSDVFLLPILPGKLVKLFFVSLWLSFGLALWIINRNKNISKRSDLPVKLTTNNILTLMLFGFIGGGISAIFGNGIDILTFTLLTLYFRIDEKIATPTSVVLMTVMTVFGFLWHLLFQQDISPIVVVYLLGAIPICIVMAPVGAYTLSILNRKVIAGFLYFVIVAQFITALFVIKPDLNNVLFIILVVLVGLGLFYFMSKKHVHELKTEDFLSAP